MSEGERRIADTTGRFLQAVKDGKEVDDPKWSNGRCLLSNHRLILVGRGGKRTVPLSAVDSVKPRSGNRTAVAGVSSYTSLQMGEDVLLLSVKEHRAFELDLCSTLLSDERLLVRHPAVEGGVVRETEWETARVNLGGDETLNVATTNGGYVGIDVDDVTKVDVAERSVKDELMKVVEVEHSEAGTSVETHVAGTARCCSLLLAILSRGAAKNSSEIDLDAQEKQVLMALYSGVSPFEIPEFTGVDVEQVEETYAHLVELDVLSEIRKRREVALTPRGRNLASEAINDE